MRDFPEDFLFGSSTAAHQVEGGNTGNNWWAWEHAPGSPAVEPSGDAIDQYHRYDVRLRAARRAGAEGAPDQPRVVADRAQPRRVEHRRAGALPARARQPRRPRADRLRHAQPLHDPAVARRARRLAGDRRDRALRALLRARREPSRRPDAVRLHDQRAADRLDDGLPVGRVPARRRATRARGGAARDVSSRPTRRPFARSAAGAASPGRASACRCRPSSRPRDEPACIAAYEELRREMIEIYLEDLQGDFVGVQYYTRQRVDPAAAGGFAPAPEGAPLTQMGWEIHPEGLYDAISEASGSGLPVVITENGIATADDAERIDYLRSHVGAGQARARRRDRRPRLHLLVGVRQLRVERGLPPALRSDRDRPRRRSRAGGPPERPRVREPLTAAAASPI